MDILFLRDFRLELIIGLYEWERKAPQPVMIDLEIGFGQRQPRRAAIHDADIGSAVAFASAGDAEQRSKSIS